MRATDSDPDRPPWPSHAAGPELAWLVLWLACVALIIARPDWQVVPLDVIWVSLALLYGFRIWPSRLMLALVATAAATTAAALGSDAIMHVRVTGESVGQIPLVAGLVAMMAWQAQRWLADKQRLAKRLDAQAEQGRSSVTLTTSRPDQDRSG